MSNIPSGLKCEVTPEQAYPGGVPEIPDGWDFVRFGAEPLAEGEQFIHSNEGITGYLSPGYARIVIRRRPVKLRRWLVELPDCPNLFDGGPHFHLPFSMKPGDHINLIREVKPITRDELEAARVNCMNQYTGGPYNMLWIRLMLRALGIEVED